MTFKRLLNYLKPYKKNIIIVSIIVTISSIVTIFIPKLLGDFITSIYNSITNKTDLDFKYLYILLTIIATFYIFNIISTYIENYVMNTTCQKALYNLRNEASEKLSKLSLSYYDTHSKGEILTHFNNDIEAISTLFTQVISKTINYSISFIGFLIIMFYISPLLTLITLFSLPLVALTSKLLLKLSKKKREQYFQKMSFINSVITESYTNKEIISLYNNDEQMALNFNNLNKDLTKTNIKAALITNFLSPLSSLINYLVYLLIILIGAKHVFAGKLKFGQIQSLIQYTKQLSTPINSFSSLLSQIQSALIASNRVFNLLDANEEVDEGNKKVQPIESIEFKNVSFSYEDKSFIENLNLTINKGEKVAIIGETGSGKSTIINLLMRFYKINNGDILVNNISIYNYNLKDYYKEISLVPQDTWLLNDTIQNNLKYANLEADLHLIKKVCKQTNSLNFIQNLPNNFNEIVNEDSLNISEGEKQLLTISRALLKEHNLLVLDEATSNIDSKTEKLIEDTIENFSKDKITLIVAHRLSTILNADKIIVMKDGRIIESGSPKNLYNEKGEYYRFLQAL